MDTKKLFSVTVDLGVVIFVNAQNLIKYKDLPLAYLFKWLSLKRANLSQWRWNKSLCLCC